MMAPPPNPLPPHSLHIIYIANRQIMTDKFSKQNKSGPSEQLISMVTAAFRHHHAYSDSAESSLAELASDTNRDSNGLGIRSASGVREVLYQSDNMHVVLSVSADEDGGLKTLRGQIFLANADEGSTADSLEGVILSMKQLRGDTRFGLSDTLGRFCLSGLESDSYTIEIQSSNGKLIIEDLDV
mgnify:CR=1 FL=1